MADPVSDIVPADKKMEPATTAALINAGSSVLKGALGGSGPAGPSRADQSLYQTFGFDNSGFTVATGKASASGSPSKLPWPWIIGGLVVAVLIWKRA